MMKLFATFLEKNSTEYGSTHQEFVQKQTNKWTQKPQKNTTVEMFLFHIYPWIHCLSTVTFVRTDLCANATLMETTQ